MDLDKIGKFIADNRKLQSLTQEQLGEKLNVTAKTISRWENGNYMPDLSLLIPLSKVLNITLNELLIGEKIPIKDLKQKTEESLQVAVNYSKKEISKAKKRLLLVSSLLIFMVIGVFAIIEHTYFTPNSWHEGDVSQWSTLFPNHSAYEMGLNKYDRPVFKNPDKALSKAKIDYSDAIKIIRKQFDLPPLTKYTYQAFGTYGWQIKSDDKKVKEQGQMLTAFVDIYENSFE